MHREGWEGLDALSRVVHQSPHRRLQALVIIGEPHTFLPIPCGRLSRNWQPHMMHAGLLPRHGCHVNRLINVAKGWS
jgi:hypothetical protein